MKTDITFFTKRGFSGVDLLFVIATVVVLTIVLSLWMSLPKEGAKRDYCINNLKQTGIGSRLFSIDGAPYLEYNATNEVWQYFQLVGREIGSPKVLVCTEDAKMNNRTPALDFETPATTTTANFAHPTRQNKALSYFYSPDAPESEPGTILAGDRNISTNKMTISGMITVERNTPVQWTKGPHGTDGNILLADGSAQQVTTTRLRDAFTINTNVTQRLLIP